MANTTSVKGSAAAKAVGTVKNIIGSATATDTSGVTRTLQVGDKVYANEVIKTSEAGAILIEFANGNNANLGRDSSMTLTGDIFGIQSALAPAGAEKMSAAQKAAVQDAQAKIAAGLDPTQVTEAAAAGPNAAGSATEGSGYNFVVVDQLAARGEVTSGFPTGPISVVLEQPPAELGIEPFTLPEGEGIGGEEGGRRQPADRGRRWHQQDVQFPAHRRPQGGEALGNEILVRREMVVGQRLPVRQQPHAQPRREPRDLVEQPLRVRRARRHHRQ